MFLELRQSIRRGHFDTHSAQITGECRGRSDHGVFIKAMSAIVRKPSLTSSVRNVKMGRAGSWTAPRSREMLGEIPDADRETLRCTSSYIDAEPRRWYNRSRGRQRSANQRAESTCLSRVACLSCISPVRGPFRVTFVYGTRPAPLTLSRPICH